MEKKYKLIGFDLDGTLVDSLPALALSVQLAFQDFNLPQVTEAQVGAWIGNGVDVLLQRAIDWTNLPVEPATIEDIKQAFHKHYTKYRGANAHLFPNVKQTLTELHEQGYILAVVTNKPTQHVLPILEACEIDHLFAISLGGQDTPILKPHPAPLYYLCGKFGLYPKEILFVGDSKNDILAARNAGCDVVGLTYGYNYNIPIAESNPDWVFDDFGLILTITN